jgi:sulfoxide reductase catalytic subunit YedY
MGKNRFKYSEITPERVFLNRRSVMTKSLSFLAFLGANSSSWASEGYVKSQWSSEAKPNSYEDITTYNNFYEFGTDKSDPAKYAHNLKTRPWVVEVGGLVSKPGMYDFDEIIKNIALEERIYSFRCVEGWSMVIPWLGFSLSEVLKKVEPLSSAKYVAFETLVRPEEMIGQRYNILDWPYREGLTIAEAMHPLTMLSTGLYGKELPNQNGAPLRLVVPWKYGFKSIKSIVKIRFTDTQPETSWNMQSPREYGFYSNVNPDVDHPRWSQATERPIGKGIFAKRKKTLKFNGYGDEVANLYSGMDLSKFY